MKHGVLVWSALSMLALSGVARGEGEADKSYRTVAGIEYAKPDGQPLLLDAYLPKTQGDHPAVLVVHGGAWKSGNKYQLAPYAIALAQRGYAAFAINYRLAPRYPFPAQIDDCRAAVKWIRDHAKEYHVDPARIGGIGYSAGGHLVALLGAQSDEDAANTGKTSCRLQCVVAGGAPVDFTTMEPNSRRVSYWLGGTPSERLGAYRDASPFVFVSKDDPPMLFFHGTDDELVEPTGVKAMSARLKKLGIPSEVVLVDKGRHIITALNKDALERSWSFFDRHLMKSKERVASN